MDAVDESSLSHYQVLRADPSADYAEIRRNYRAAALALHPDRFPASGRIEEGAESQTLPRNDRLAIGASSDVQHPVKTFTPGHSSESEQFLRVQKAWEVLRDPESRAVYDKFLSAQRISHQREEASKVIGEEVFIQEMDLIEGNEGQAVEYSYPCRCGDYFVVSAEELKEAGYTERPGSGRSLENEDIAERPKHVQWQQSYLILSCQSCSLHIRLRFDSQSD